MVFAGGHGTCLVTGFWDPPTGVDSNISGWNAFDPPYYNKVVGWISYDSNHSFTLYMRYFCSFCFTQNKCHHLRWWTGGEVVKMSVF